MPFHAFKPIRYIGPVKVRRSSRKIVAKAKPEPFKLKKFQNVPSKLSLHTTEPGTASGSPDKERPRTAVSSRPKSVSVVAFGRTSHPEEANKEQEHEVENVNHLNLE